MSAPGGILMAKIIMPDDLAGPDELPLEGGASDEDQVDVAETFEEGERPANIIMAAAQGAQTGVKLAVAVGAMVLAFVALVALANGLLGGLGNMVGIPDLSFQRLVGYVFQPIMFLIGVPWEQANVAGGLFGTKLVLNEFVAFIDLGAMPAGALDERTPRDRHLCAVRLRQFQLDRHPDGGDGRPRPEPAAGDRPARHPRAARRLARQSDERRAREPDASLNLSANKRIMATITADHIASVSLKDADRNPDEFAQKLGRSFEDYGFAIIADHGIPDELIHRAEEKAKAFFALPEETKKTYLPRGRRRSARLHAVRDRDRQGRQGARPQGILARRPRPAGGPQVPRAHAGQCLAGRSAELQGHVQRAVRDLRPHRPEGAPRDRPLSRRSTRIISSTRCATAIRCCAPLHYPPQPEPTGNHIRAGAHEDINTITLLLGAEEAGLELLTKDGRWIPVSPKPGELVINIGDMLQRLTNGRLRSTSHRVVNPEPGSREPRALLDALLPALPLGLPDRTAAGHGSGGRAAEVAADHRRRISPGTAARD